MGEVIAVKDAARRLGVDLDEIAMPTCGPI
jgi:hypothetical protein